MPTLVAAGDADDSAGRGSSRDLFGRGLIFVVVWSMQLVVATVASPILAYTLGPSQFGSLSAAIALYQLVTAFSVFGLDQALEIQRMEDSDGRAARGLLAVGVVCAAAVTGLVTVTMPLWAGALGFTGDQDLVRVTLLWIFPGSCVMLVLSLLQAEDRLARFAIISVISTVGGQLSGLAFMVVWGRSAVTYAWGGVLSQGVAVVVGLLWTKPLVRGLRDRAVTAKAIRLGVPLVFTTLSVFVLNAGDRFIIKRVLGDAQVGRYQVAYTIGYVLVLVLTFTNRAWVPRLAAISDTHLRWRIIRESRDGIYRLLLPAILGMTIAAPAVLRVIAPPSFGQDRELVVVVFLIGLAALPNAASGATGRMLITLRRSHPLAVSAGVATVVKIVLTLLAVHWWGLMGAASASLVAFVGQAVVQRRSVPAEFTRERSETALLVLVGVTVTLAGLSILLPTDGTWWLVIRFAAGVGCLPWFVKALRGLRMGAGPGREQETSRCGQG